MQAFEAFSPISWSQVTQNLGGKLARINFRTGKVIKFDRQMQPPWGKLAKRDGMPDIASIEKVWWTS